VRFLNQLGKICLGAGVSLQDASDHHNWNMPPLTSMKSPVTKPDRAEA
jgi:hypothetical protein